MCTELSTRFHRSTNVSLQNDGAASDISSKGIAIDLSPKSEGMYDSFMSSSSSAITTNSVCKEKTWLQQKLESEMEQERQSFQTDRQSILADLEKIKQKLKKIIDENETGPSNTKLDINEFNLNAEETDKFLDEAQRDRLEKEDFLTKFCSSQNKLTALILSRTWDSIDVKGTTLRGVFTKLKVENYALIKSNELVDDLERIVLHRRAETFVNRGDIFEPWIPKTTSQLEIGLNKLPGCTRDTNGAFNNDDNGQVEQHQNPHYVLPLSGTTSHLYIRPFPYRYNQMEVVTYPQMRAETVMGFVNNISSLLHFMKLHFPYVFVCSTIAWLSASISIKFSIR